MNEEHTSISGRDFIDWLIGQGIVAGSCIEVAIYAGLIDDVRIEARSSGDTRLTNRRLVEREPITPATSEQMAGATS